MGSCEPHHHWLPQRTEHQGEPCRLESGGAAPLQRKVLFVFSEIRKENTAVPVPWLLDTIPATGALLRMGWTLHVMLSGISGGGGQAGAPRFPGYRAVSSSVLIHCTSLHLHV